MSEPRTERRALPRGQLLPRPFGPQGLERQFLEDYRRGSLGMLRAGLLVGALLAFALAASLVLRTAGHPPPARLAACALLGAVLVALARAIRRRRELVVRHHAWLVGGVCALTLLVIVGMYVLRIEEHRAAWHQEAGGIVLVTLLVFAFARLPIGLVAGIAALGNLGFLAGFWSRGAPLLPVAVYVVMAMLAGIAIASQIERRERTLFLQIRRTAAADAAKSRMLSAVSHDLRQPLGAMSLHVGLLRHHEATLRALGLDGQLGRLDACVRAMDDTLSRLLELGRLQASHEPLPTRPTDLRAVLDRLHAVHVLQAIGAGIELRIRAPGPRACQVASDTQHLFAMLSNLLHNALKYTALAHPHGGGRVEVRVWRRGSRVLVVVRDNGPGIERLHHERIFEAYVQLANPEQDHRRGYGLGLAVVRQTAARLDGHQLGLRSRPARGSCFAIALPPCAPGAVAAQPAALVATPGTGQRPDLVPIPADCTGACVLLVEDDRAVRETLALLLGHWGLLVEAAPDVERAIATLEGLERLPDVVLTDWRLPNARVGAEVIDAARETCGYALPAVVVTADRLDAAALARLPSDCALLRKPIDCDALARALAAAIRSGVLRRDRMLREAEPDPV